MILLSDQIDEVVMLDHHADVLFVRDWTKFEKLPEKFFAM